MVASAGGYLNLRKNWQKSRGMRADAPAWVVFGWRNLIEYTVLKIPL